jgi:hypothetical protein
MIFPKSLIQSLLALYGFGEKTAPQRRRPAPISIGRPSDSRFA